MQINGPNEETIAFEFRELDTVEKHYSIIEKKPWPVHGLRRSFVSIFRVSVLL